MRLKRKLPSFIFGVTVGLLIGAGFFMFKISDVFNRLKETSRENITIVEQQVKNSEPQKQKKSNNERFKIDLGNSKKVNYREADSLINQDMGITVATDELLATKNARIIHIDKNESSDTAIARMAGVEEVESDQYQIEFWKTPLNSKGYRFSKNKIMLYGFVDFNNVVIYELEQSHYIKCSGQVYRIFSGGDFKPLEKVVDTELLARIN